MTKKQPDWFLFVIRDKTLLLFFYCIVLEGKSADKFFTSTVFKAAATGRIFLTSLQGQEMSCERKYFSAGEMAGMAQ